MRIRKKKIACMTFGVLYSTLNNLLSTLIWCKKFKILENFVFLDLKFRGVSKNLRKFCFLGFKITSRFTLGEQFGTNVCVYFNTKW